MAEPKGTQTWTVDASAMGGKGMFWRTHCGNDKMLTRPSDAKPGFVANGERFRGVEVRRHVGAAARPTASRSAQPRVSRAAQRSA